jgi:glycine/D-amino acid oxidase-like deaminating enzyme
VVGIGGGIAGLTISYLLSKAGKKVTVIEDGYIGSGETGRTTAHITHALDDRYYLYQTFKEYFRMCFMYNIYFMSNTIPRRPVVSCDLFWSNIRKYI